MDAETKQAVDRCWELIALIKEDMRMMRVEMEDAVFITNERMIEAGLPRWCQHKTKKGRSFANLKKRIEAHSKKRHYKQQMIDLEKREKSDNLKDYYLYVKAEQPIRYNDEDREAAISQNYLNFAKAIGLV